MKLMRLSLVASAAILATAAFSEDRVAIGCDTVFRGAIVSGIQPLAITLKNNGSDISGTVTVDGAGAPTHYPVDLRAGETRQIIAYAESAYDLTLVTFDGPRTHVRTQYIAPPRAAGPNTCILVASDHPGSGLFLSRTETAKNAISGDKSEPTTIADCRVDEMPDRAVAYSSLVAVVLGPGSERLTNEAVAALKRYAVEGGTLIFTAATSNELLSDSRLAPIFPLKNLRVVTVASNDPGNSVFSVAIPSNYRLISGDPVEGTRIRTKIGSNPIASERGIGLGRTVFVGFDPNEAPFNDWDGRSAFFAKFTGLGDWNLITQFRSATERWSEVASTSYEMRGTAPVPASVPLSTMVQVASSKPHSDPFHVELPPAERIFSILGLYFVVVVPLNFLVLKKFKRGEWAWFTAPALSLAFAGVLFKSAQSLYQFETSRATEGVVVWSESAKTGVFMGFTKLFISQGGTYDLRLHDVESIVGAPASITDPRTVSASVEATDDGKQLVVPDLEVSNLSYRGLPFEQRVQPSAMLETKFVAASPTQITVSIHNASKWPMKDVNVWNGAKGARVGDLMPGDTKSMSVAYGPRDANANYGADDVRTIGFRSGQVVLTAAQISEFEVGPQIGKAVSDGNRVGLIQVVDRPQAAQPKVKEQ